MALGYFVVHIAGRAYGVRQADASMLACSYDEVRARIVRRGSHVAPAIQRQGAAIIANSFIRSHLQGAVAVGGVVGKSLTDMLFDSHVVWAPDGDEAFDDGSYVLQFDVGEEARLVAFRNSDDGAVDVSEVWLPAHEFYALISAWVAAFTDEWHASPKHK